MESQHSFRGHKAVPPVLALDLGGSHVTCAVIQDRTCLAKRTAHIACHSFRGVLPTFEKLIEQATLSAGVAVSACAGIVLGFPGIVNATSATVVSTNAKFDDARGFDLRGWAQDRFGLPLLLENDARLAAMGEHFCGAATQARDLVLVTLGTGIGVAVLHGGKPLRGHASQAGVLGGHLPVALHGRRCTCGNLGCAEAEASTWALDGVSADWPNFQGSALAEARPVDFARLFSANDHGDRVAQEVLAHCIHVWSVLAVALIHAFTPEVILFGGSVMAREADIIPRIRDYVRAHAWLPEGEVAIRHAELGSDAALYGAVPFFFEASA